MTDGFKPLPGEHGVRFGCGALAGLVVGFLLALRWSSGDARLSVGVASAAAIACGLLAAAFGDSFWEWLSRVISWYR